MIQGDHEDAPGQLELNWMFDDVLRNSDRLTTYRQICAQVARERGLHACFMSKPFMNVSASGCHHNMSLWTGGKDVGQQVASKKSGCLEWTASFLICQGGEQLISCRIPEIDQSHKPGPVGLKSIGGVIEHLGRFDFNRLVNG